MSGDKMVPSLLERRRRITVRDSAWRSREVALEIAATSFAGTVSTPATRQPTAPLQWSVRWELIELHLAHRTTHFIGGAGK